jgi:hypothetical protein
MQGERNLKSKVNYLNQFYFFIYLFVLSKLDSIFRQELEDIINNKYKKINPKGPGG